MQKKILFAVLGALIFSPVILPQNNFMSAQIVFAETFEVEADGEYIMGDGTEENQGVAKERAREAAKRNASEKVCTLIESVSEVENGELTRDEIRTISANILKIVSAPVKIDTNGDSVIFRCHVTALADTSNINEKFLRDRKNLEELVRKNNEQAAQIEKLNAEINSLKQKYKTASKSEKQKIKADVKRNEEKFTATQYVEKGNSCFDAQKFAQALDYYNKAIELNPQNDEAWNNAASAYYKLNTYEKAVEYYRKSVELNPKNNIIVRRLKEGNAYFDAGYFGLAIEYYNQVLEIDSENDAAWNNAASAYNKIGNFQKAIEYYKKSLELNSQNDAAWYNLGVAYSNAEDFKSAAECFSKAAELNPAEKIYRVALAKVRS